MLVSKEKRGIVSGKSSGMVVARQKFRLSNCSDQELEVGKR